MTFVFFHIHYYLSNVGDTYFGFSFVALYIKVKLGIPRIKHNKILTKFKIKRYL